MTVTRVRLHRIRLPFKRRYTHRQADRTDTEGLIAEVHLASGHRGFGEALPRAYVTGETIASVTDTLTDVWRARWIEAPTDDFSLLLPWLEGALDAAMAERTLAAYGALELALLDAVGRATGQSVAACFDAPARARVRYTGPITAGTPEAAARLGRFMRLGRLADVKVKVGFPNDGAVLAAVRRAVGPRMDVRVDANGAWSAPEAVACIRALRPHHISGVEQPIAAGNVTALAEVQAAVDVPIIADESACTVGDVERLAAARACRMINVRVGKCGGMLGARRVACAAERAGLAWHIGCLVGETALLSAAGRHFAFGVPGWKYAEGSYGPFLLVRDIATPQPRWGWRGAAKPLRGPGLGVTVDDAALAAVTEETRDVM